MRIIIHRESLTFDSNSVGSHSRPKPFELRVQLARFSGTNKTIFRVFFFLPVLRNESFIVSLNTRWIKPSSGQYCACLLTVNSKKKKKNAWKYDRIDIRLSADSLGRTHLRHVLISLRVRSIRTCILDIDSAMTTKRLPPSDINANETHTIRRLTYYYYFFFCDSGT